MEEELKTVTENDNIELLQENDEIELEEKRENDEKEESGGEDGDNIDVLPRTRVRKIMRIDPDISKMTAEALTLVSFATTLFLRHLGEITAKETLHRKKRIMRPEHLRVAVQKHQPTCDFLLDCLPQPSAPVQERPKERIRPVEKQILPGTRRIDDFFQRQ